MICKNNKPKNYAAIAEIADLKRVWRKKLQKCEHSRSRQEEYLVLVVLIFVKPLQDYCLSQAQSRSASHAAWNKIINPAAVNNFLVYQYFQVSVTVRLSVASWAKEIIKFLYLCSNLQLAQQGFSRWTRQGQLSSENCKYFQSDRELWIRLNILRWGVRSEAISLPPPDWQ